jgi:asparagine synthase (glutamine-hydrolysing)
MVPDTVFLEKSKLYAKKEKVNLSSKESLYYYEIYRKYFDMPFTLGKSDAACPNCSYSIPKNSHFCRMCGSYPI